MVIPTPLLHRTFRITVDIEAMVNAMPRDVANSTGESLHFHHTLVQMNWTCGNKHDVSSFAFVVIQMRTSQLLRKSFFS